MSYPDEKRLPSSKDEGRIEDGVSSPPLSSTTSRDLDDNYEVYKQSQGDEMSPEDATKVLRKIDLRIMPILFFTYMLQYLDKNSINFASVYGLSKGTHLHGQDYSWLGSIFYFGYLIAQYPAGYAMQKLPIGKFLGCATLLWGTILMTTPGCSSFPGIATNRFMLGLTEATVNPGFVLMMSIWYTSAEQPLRLEGYYSTLGIATMFGGLIGYAVGHINHGLAKWQWVFIIFGSISVVCGIWSLLFLPDLPSTANFLSSRERAVACQRVAANRQGVKNRHFKMYQVRQAALDPKTWMLFFMAIGGSIPNAATTSFTSIVISSFGFSTLGSQYMQIPGGAVQFLAVLLGGWLCTRYASRFHVRSTVMITANTICIIGSALLVGLPSHNKWGRLVALWLCYCQAVGFSLSFTIMSSNIAGYTKKQVTSALYFTAFCVGNIISPQTFKASEKPGYKSAYIAMLVGYTLKLAMAVAIYLYMYRENKRRDRAAVAMGPGGVPSNRAGTGVISKEEREAIEKGMRDCTELDNPGFRYTL